MNELTRSEVREQAAEAATPINKLVNPSDIDDTADSWDEIDDYTLNDELAYSAWIIMSEEQQPFHGIAHDLAMTLWKESMPRVAMEHLDYNEMETAVIEANVWPNKMDKWEIRETLEENYRKDDSMSFIYHECYNESSDEVSAGIIDGMKPQTDE